MPQTSKFLVLQNIIKPRLTLSSSAVILRNNILYVAFWKITLNLMEFTLVEPKFILELLRSVVFSFHHLSLALEMFLGRFLRSQMSPHNRR